MTQFKGTPGPWFGDNGRAIGPKSTEDDQSYGMIIPVGWVEFDPEVEVQVANQRIMATAPELLEALQNPILSYDNFRERTSRNGDPENPLMIDARAAIAKATGETK